MSKAYQSFVKNLKRFNTDIELSDEELKFKYIINKLSSYEKNPNRYNALNYDIGYEDEQAEQHINLHGKISNFYNPMSWHETGSIVKILKSQGQKNVIFELLREVGITDGKYLDNHEFSDELNYSLAWFKQDAENIAKYMPKNIELAKKLAKWVIETTILLYDLETAGQQLDIAKAEEFKELDLLNFITNDRKDGSIFVIPLNLFHMRDKYDEIINLLISSGLDINGSGISGLNRLNDGEPMALKEIRYLKNPDQNFNHRYNSISFQEKDDLEKKLKQMKTTIFDFEYIISYGNENYVISLLPRVKFESDLQMASFIAIAFAKEKNKLVSHILKHFKINMTKQEFIEIIPKDENAAFKFKQLLEHLKSLDPETKICEHFEKPFLEQKYFDDMAFQIKDIISNIARIDITEAGFRHKITCDYSEPVILRCMNKLNKEGKKADYLNIAKELGITDGEYRESNTNELNYCLALLKKDIANIEKYKPTNPELQNILTILISNFSVGFNDLDMLGLIFKLNLINLDIPTLSYHNESLQYNIFDFLKMPFINEHIARDALNFLKSKGLSIFENKFKLNKILFYIGQEIHICKIIQIMPEEYIFEIMPNIKLHLEKQEINYISEAVKYNKLKVAEKMCSKWHFDDLCSDNMGRHYVNELFLKSLDDEQKLKFFEPYLPAKFDQIGLKDFYNMLHYLQDIYKSITPYIDHANNMYKSKILTKAKMFNYNKPSEIIYYCKKENAEDSSGVKLFKAAYLSDKESFAKIYNEFNGSKKLLNLVVKHITYIAISQENDGLLSFVKENAPNLGEALKDYINIDNNLMLISNYMSNLYSYILRDSDYIPISFGALRNVLDKDSITKLNSGVKKLKNHDIQKTFMEIVKISENANSPDENQNFSLTNYEANECLSSLSEFTSSVVDTITNASIEAPANIMGEGDDNHDQ